MKNLWTICKYEFCRYFSSPLAYVYLIAFLILNALFTFYLGNILERGQADLMPMFSYLPWLYLLFIPGIAMRLWAEEFKSKTIYQMMSLPVEIGSYVWGKFLAAWAFCLLALLLTTPLWVTINYIGTPDNTAIFVGYLASFILAGAMIAIAQTMSALTQNQVIALVLAVLANILFFLSTLEFVQGNLRSFLPIAALDIIASFSFLEHFFLMAQGLIELKAIIFFISIVVLFNFITTIVVNFKTSGTSVWLKAKNKTYYVLILVLAGIGFIGFNLIAGKVFETSQLDATKDKRFSLSESTINILQNLKEPVHVKLYYSQILSEKNPEFRALFENIKIKLKQYKKIAKNNFSYFILSPQTLDETEDMAIANGLQALPIIDSNQAGFFGMVINDAIDNKQIIPFFPLQRKNYIEQDLTEKIYLLNNQKKYLGLITSLPIYEEHIGSVVTSTWEIANQLEKFYNVIKIDNKNPKIENIEALMIVAPENLSPELIENIKSYKNSGGNFLILLDVAPEAIRNIAPSTKLLEASNFSGLEKEFGFEFFPTVVVADLENALNVDATIDYANNPMITQDVLQFVLKNKNINQNNQITKGLKRILLASAGIIAPYNNEVDFVPLLWASKNSALMSSGYVYQNVNPAEILANFKKDDYRKIMAAKITEKNSSTPFRAIAIADSDFIYDSFWTSSFRVLENNYNITLMDNINFVLNALDDLLKNNDLISLRTKSNNDYRLEKLEEIRKSSQLEYKLEEQKVLNQINFTKKALQEIWGKKDFEERQNFVPDELALMAKLRKELSQLKIKLGLIKDNAYHKLNQIETKIKFLNIYALAFIILLALLWQNRQRKKIVTTEKLIINATFKKFSIISLTLLALGIASNWQTNLTQNNKLVFPNLEKNINDLDVIKITTVEKQLEFYKTTEGWKLKGFEDFVVYNPRIKSLLSALLDARFYEEKSDKVENLAHFDLLAIDNPKSTATRIELLNNNKIYQDFYIGKYDINLGRGSRGAYFREVDNFKVWLIWADLIDITPNWQDFTYSSLWNLRFGQAIEQKAEFIKDMINIKFMASAKNLENPTKIKTLSIKTTDNVVVIDFFKNLDTYWVKYNLKEFNDIYYQISPQDMEKLQNEN